MGRVVTNDRLEVVCCLFFGTHHVLLCLFGGRKHNKTNQRRKRRRSLSHTRRQTTWQRSLVSTFRCIYTHTHTHTISLLRLSGGVKNFSLSLLSNQSSSGDECTTSVVRTHFRGIHPQTLLIITCMYTHNTRRGYPAHVSDRMTTVCVCVCSSVLKKPRKFGRVFTRFRFSQYSTELGNKGEFQTSLVRAEKSHTVLMMYITGN